jgi:hypothetical protein
VSWVAGLMARRAPDRPPSRRSSQDNDHECAKSGDRVDTARDGGPAESRAWIGGDELVVSAIDTRVAVGVAIDAMGLGGA